MMKIYKAMMRLPLFLLLVAATGCDYNDIPVNDGDIVLEILDDDGNAIEGITQTFAFGANHSYTVRSSNINYVKITKPKGWLCELVPSSRHFSITAPQFSDLNSDASGEVIIDIAHQTGRTLQVKIPVATIENDILLTIDPDEIAGTQVFAFGRRKEYAFMSQNVASVDLAVPKGSRSEKKRDDCFGPGRRLGIRENREAGRHPAQPARNGWHGNYYRPGTIDRTSRNHLR